MSDQSTDQTTPHERERAAAERYNALIDAVHRGCEGLDAWAAQCILAAVVPVLRKQIAQDIRAVDPVEWALAGQDAGLIAAQITMGVKA